MKWLKKIWFKIVLEIVTIFLMWGAYYFLRYLLPKKYRVKDKSIRNFIRDFGALSKNMASKNDSIGVTLEKAKNVFEHFYDLQDQELNPEEELRNLIEELDQNYVVKYDYYFINLIFRKIAMFAKTTEIVQTLSTTQHIVKCSFEINNKIESIIAIRFLGEKNEQSTYGSTFAYRKGFEYCQIINLIFDLFGNRLYIHAKNNEEIIIEKLEQEYIQKDLILDENFINSLLKEISWFKNKNLQRSYIFAGEPGCGKTSAALTISQMTSGSIVKLDSGFFNNLASKGSKMIVENLKCNFIVVDDIDRISPSDLSSFLYMLETIKDFKNKPTLLATVNHIENLDKAVIRPGRFDDIIEFGNLDEEGRKHFLSEMLKRFGCSMEEESLNKFAKITEGMTQAYLKEYCFQFQIEENVEKLFEKIERRKKYLDLTRDRYSADYEDDLKYQTDDDDEDLG